MPDNPYATATPASPPTLGYGQRGEAPIDAVNQWMRTQPWYQSLIKSFGQNPNSVKLNDAQKQAVIRAAQANGVVVDEGHNGQEVDDSGNFQAKSHALRNTLIVGGLAAATLLSAGAAGAAWGIGPALGGTALPAASGVGGLSATSLGLPVTAGLGTAGATAAGVAGAAGAGAGAAGAGAAGAAAAKGLPSWLAPVLTGVVPAVGSLVGASIQSNANTDAAKIQADSVQKALDFEKQQYADLTGRLAPYVAAGTTSTDRMSQLLGLPARPQTTATAPPTRGPSVANYGGPSPAAAPAQAPTAPAMITIQAPNGQTKQVPASEQQHWESVGAKVLGAVA